MASDTTSSSSVSAFVSSLILNLIIFTIFVLIFVTFRLKFSAVYQPRATIETVPAEKKADPQPAGPFSWIFFILSRPESYIIEKAGVDGYFFLRYLVTFGFLGVIGGVFLWPILFAVNATGGGTAKGFDIISLSNVTKKWHVFAHLFCSWLFFGLIIYTIYKELIYYVSFRHALQVSPKYASLQSSKTLMIDNVPESLLNEESLLRLFPAVTNVWFTRKTKELQKLVKKRDKLAGKLEGGMNKVLNKSMKIRAKAIKKNKALPEPENELVSYIPEKKMPTYKDKPIPFVGQKKKLFTEGFDEVGELNTEISTQQETYPAGFDKTGSVFLEFISHLELQRAYQAVPYSKELKLCRRFTNVAPEDIIWENTGLSFKTRAVKKTLAVTVLTLLIIFWAIPVAVVGAISNINYLTDKVHFLKFINNLPDKLMGIITALLPTIALSVLMSLLPPFISKMGKVGGCMTVQEVNKWTQQWYYAFQVIQVFLVTTLASAASSSVTKIIKNPSSAMTLLGQKLPPAANFYISYMLLQGLSISSGTLARIVPLILSFVLGRILDSTPRKKWNRAHSLGQPTWSVMYSLYGMFTVIMITYSIISPIIIAFTTIAYILIYIAYLYCLNYVLDHAVDNRGRNYPLALFEVFVGLYLGEICLTALFVFRKNWACVVLEVLMIVVTIISHLYFRWIFEPLLDTVPVGATKEADAGIEGAYPMKDQGLKQIKEEGKSYFVGGEDRELTNLKSADDRSSPFADDNANFDDGKTQQTNTNSVAHEQSLFSDSNTAHDLEKIGSLDNEEKPLREANQYEANSSGSNMPKLSNFANPSLVTDFLNKFHKPRQYQSFNFCRSIMPSSYHVPVIRDEADLSNGFNDPAITAEEPKLWIARDPVGLSTNFVKLSEGKILVSDENAIYNEKGASMWTGNPPDYTEEVKG